MILKVTKSDIVGDWIEILESDSFEFVIYAISGANAFIYIDEGFDTKLNIPYLIIPVPNGITPGAVMLIGNARATRLGLPILKQRGKASIEDNEL